MAVRKKLEVGAAFDLQAIKRFSEHNGYSISMNGGICSLHNNKGQYTQFTWYNGYWYCDVIWARITNPYHPFYKPGPDDIEIYE